MTIGKPEVIEIYDAEVARLRTLRTDVPGMTGGLASDVIAKLAWGGTRSLVFGRLHEERPSPPASEALMRDALHEPKKESKQAATDRRNAEALRLAKAGNVAAAEVLLNAPLERPLQLSKELRREHESHSLTQKHHQIDLWDEADALVLAAGITETGRV